MKRYPSIPRKFVGKKRPRLTHVFDKLDGSNLRFEWDRKRGWHRFGSRRRVLDRTDPTFGHAMGLFLTRLAEPVERAAVDQGWPALVAFAEFWGPGSLAGQHVPGAEQYLSLFDVAPYRHGFVGPERFLDLFGHCDIPRYLGQHVWDDAFVARVRAGELQGVTFEGVVGKAGDRHRLVMAKAKTQAWIDAVIARYGVDKGGALVTS